MKAATIIRINGIKGMIIGNHLGIAVTLRARGSNKIIQETYSGIIMPTESRLWIPL